MLLSLKLEDVSRETSSFSLKRNADSWCGYQNLGRNLRVILA